MEQAITRLRAQRSEVTNESKRAGYEDGSNYLLQEADYSTTKKLVALWNHSDSMRLSEPFRDVFSIVDRDAAERYGQRLDEDALSHDDWALGFIRGIGDTWRRIEKEVERS